MTNSCFVFGLLQVAIKNPRDNPGRLISSEIRSTAIKECHYFSFGSKELYISEKRQRRNLLRSFDSHDLFIKLDRNFYCRPPTNISYCDKEQAIIKQKLDDDFWSR